jgi:hypothetical protein
MWVCEGSLRTTWVQCVAHAEYVVWIDLPFALRLKRVLLRQLRDWGQIKADCPDGCPRRFNLTEIRWLFRSRRKQDRAFTKHFSKAPEGVRLVRLRTPQSIENFFRSLKYL